MKNTLTDKDIDEAIASEHIYDLAHKTTAIVLVLRNGFEVVGTSACVDPANYNQEIGAKYARENARKKVWELEGYLLQSALRDVPE